MLGNKRHVANFTRNVKSQALNNNNIPNTVNDLINAPSTTHTAHLTGETPPYNRFFVINSPSYNYRIGQEKGGGGGGRYFFLTNIKTNQLIEAGETSTRELDRS